MAPRRARLDGNRRVVVDRPDHSRVFAERGGRGYVQHPYMYHGHEFAQRTYWDHGHAYAAYYGRYPYHWVYLEVYAPVRYYPVGFYGWAYHPWVTPVPVDAGFAQGAPPPDANAQAEITAQANAADQAEREDASAAVAQGGAGAGPSGPPPTISLGQTPDQVTAAIGQPSRIVDLGAKKIYSYPDMKITFMNGKVSDVQ